MLTSEMSIQEVVKDCVSFGRADECDLLHLFFDLCIECDPDVVFDKKCDFLSFLLKMVLFFMRLTYIQVLIKKIILEAKKTDFV